MNRFLKAAGLLALVCLIVCAVALIKTHHKDARVKEHVKNLQQALAPKPATPTESADPDRKNGCEAALQTANQNSAILKNWKQYGTYVNVRVHGGFYRTDFEHKRELDKMVRCVVSDGRAEDQGLRHVTYRDAKTDELVAEWSKATGFRLSE